MPLTVRYVLRVALRAVPGISFLSINNYLFIYLFMCFITMVFMIIYLYDLFVHI